MLGVSTDIRAPAAPALPQARQHGLLGGVLTMTCAIVAAACGPLQQQQAEPAPRPGVLTAGAGTIPVPRAGQAIPAAPGGAIAPRIALLLPLSGAQRPVAEAVRDGFIAAYLDDNAGGPRPEIMILDEEQPGAVEAYRRAINAGAGLVIGPLLKDSVAQVAAVGGGVTTVTLNYLESGAPAPAQFYQFSLAPEDEARQVAERAAGNGHLHALVLAPDTEWGRRMLTAFAPTLESLAGAVLAYRFYDPVPPISQRNCSGCCCSTRAAPDTASWRRIWAFPRNSSLDAGRMWTSYSSLPTLPLAG